MSAKTNHQITGARIPVILIDETTKREFLMSPMSDKDLSEVELWLQCKYIQQTPAATQAERDEVRRVAATLSTSAGIGATMIDSVDGVARFAWQSIARSHPEIRFTTLLRLMQLEENRAEFNAKFKVLNEVDYSTLRRKPIEKSESTKAQEQVDKATIYCLLAEMYGWTFATIADMTPLHQLAALTKGKNVAASGRKLHFATSEDYDKWLAERLKNNNG